MKEVQSSAASAVVVSSKIRMLLRAMSTLLTSATAQCFGPKLCRSGLVLAVFTLPLLIPARAPAQANSGGAVHSKAPALLPAGFAGWNLAGPMQQSTSAAAADSGNADVLGEDGFVEFAAGDYSREDGKLNVRAIRFADASGAYAAYTFYRRPGMRQEDIGQGAANDGTHILFWHGTTVVDATFDHLSAMSAAELRELAQMLPEANGSAGVLPTLPRYLPEKGIAPTRLEALSTRYALGPAGYVHSGGVLPPGLVGFDRGAETLSAAYTSTGRDGVLTLINYPTPQLAIERQQAILAFFKAGNSQQAAWPQALAESSPESLLCRRSGPLLAVTTGSLPGVEAQKLENQVNYLAEVTWNNPAGYTSEVSKTGRLLLSIAALSGILCGAALVIGVFLGGGRALYRTLRGKPISTLQDAEFISLRLDRD
ncbi:MAG TPA: DUF6599 family protein [Acidisarcina sp.]